MFYYKCVVGVFLSFLDAFAKLWKATISSPCPSVRPSAWNSAPTGRIWINFDILSICRKSVEKIQAWIKSGKNNRYFTWRPLYIYIIPRSVLLRMRNVSDKRCRENKNRRFMVNNFFFNSRPLCDNVEEYCKRRTAHSWWHGAYVLLGG